MSLSAANAQARALAFCATAGITDASTQNVWVEVWKEIYAGLLMDLTITTTIAVDSIDTTGSPSAQSGPTTPVQPPSVVS